MLTRPMSSGTEKKCKKKFVDANQFNKEYKFEWWPQAAPRLEEVALPAQNAA